MKTNVEQIKELLKDSEYMLILADGDKTRFYGSVSNEDPNAIMSACSLLFKQLDKYKNGNINF